MSVSMIRCPNCGSTEVSQTKPDQYQCNSCSVIFHFIRPDIQKTDVVSHNCPVCGKPVQPGKGYRCNRCGKYDICEDCVSKLNPDGYVCKDCLKAAGQDCFVCGKFAFQTCKACEIRLARGETEVEIVKKVCGPCYELFFADIRELEKAKGGMPPRWGTVTYHCPNCGNICVDCVEEKKSWFSTKQVCKACGSDVRMQNYTMMYLKGDEPQSG